MGQQQLLLIVLGVILVGVAVVLGIQYFAVGAEEGAKDELVAHTLTIGANAQQWYKKPAAMGGGGGAWDGSVTNTMPYDQYFTLHLTKLHETSNSQPAPTGYTVAITNANEIVITALPKQNQGFTFVSVVTTVTPDDMTTVIN